MANFSWTIENEKEFVRALDRLALATDDFRIPFRLISSDFYRSQRKLFTLQGSGLYNPLGGFNFNQQVAFRGDNVTKEQKARTLKKEKVGFDYPLLVGRTRDLSASTLSSTHRYSLFFLGRKELQIGSTVPYGKFHQSDKPRTTLPQRKFIFIDGGPADKSQDSGINGRRERWLNIVNDHVIQLVNKKVL